MSTTQVAIIGAGGAIGRSCVDALNRRSIPCRVIGRSRERLDQLFAGRAEIAPADVAKRSDIEQALAGAESAVYAVGLPYPQFEMHPVLVRRAIEAAESAGVKRFVVVSSVYSYGVPQAPRVAETHPRQPHARKGRCRKEQEDAALQADREGKFRTLVMRLPDFYGPSAELSLADLIFRAALTGKPAMWLGDPNLPHEFVYVPDVGPVVLDLMARPDSYGQAWNFGGPGAISGRDFIAEAYSCAGREPKIRTLGKLMLQLAGIFHSMSRELVELYYLGTTPVILDDSKLQRHLGGLRKTPYRDGIRMALESYRARMTK
jgi:nucleoside-diphosphate-sugar epimerase